MKNDPKKFSYIDIIIVVILTSVIMYFLGGLSAFNKLSGINYNYLAKDSHLKEFISAYNDLTTNYYDALDKEELISGAIDGMYSKVNDPYTSYMDESDTSNLNDSLSGEYYGIGIKIERTVEGNTRIAEVFDDSPASKSGLKSGDIILKVAGEEVKDKSLDDIVGLIKNDSKDVNIVVLRNDTELSFNVKADTLLVPAVVVKLLNKDNHNIGYIKLSVFNDTADVQFENELTRLENSNIESLIIDLRNNTGGYLEVAKNIAEMFLEKNKLIYSLESKNDKQDYMDKTNEKRSYKVVVLVNKASASASEILAAALRDSYDAVLIGNKTYGKGKVQEKSSLSNGTTVKYTTAKWLTPSGECIDGIGLTPDYEINLDLSTYDSSDIYTDSQVLYTLNYLVD